jgi:hypothetical protein
MTLARNCRERERVIEAKWAVRSGEAIKRYKRTELVSIQHPTSNNQHPTVARSGSHAPKDLGKTKIEKTAQRFRSSERVKRNKGFSMNRSAEHRLGSFL